MPRDFSYSAKTILANNASNAVLNIFKFIAIALIFTVFYFIHKFVSLVFPSVISVLVIIVVSYLLARVLCRFITFPGAHWFWRRNVENYFQKAFVVKVQRSVDSLKNLMDYLIREVPWNDFMSEEELIQIKMMITSLIHLFNKQAEHGTLSVRQRRLLETFNELEELLTRTQIVNAADQKSFSLWAFFEENSEAQDGLGLPNSMLFFRNLNDGHTLLERCQDLKDRMNDITKHKGRLGSLKRWFSEDVFGTIDQVREEMESRYECSRISLQVEKNVTLDCLFIAGRNPDDVSFSSDRSDRDGKKSDSFVAENDSQYYLQFASKGNRHLRSTMIFCCPNATYYEFLYYESEWIDLYIRNGLNVFLWNYRGYGRSTGSPDIDAYKRDGEFIVDHLRREMEVKKLGVHGESIGGIVAAHIAKTKQIDFLCADRNFSSMSKLGRMLYGPYLASAYKYLTMRIDDISTDYLESNCYKMLTFDPKDEVVPLLASLKYRVTSKIIAQRLQLDDQNIDAEALNTTNSFCAKLLYPFKKWKILRDNGIYNKEVDQIVKGYHELLSQEQMLALYWAFYRVSELFLTLSGLSNLPTRGKKRANSINELSKSPNEGGTGKFERRGSLDSSVNMSVLKDGDIPDDGKRKTTDESTFGDNSKYLNETLDIRGFGNFDDAHLLKTIKRKSYADLFDDDAKSSAEVVNFLMKIFSTFEALEAGGIQISDVISKKERFRFDVFHHFINSFEIWGSYTPLHKIAEDGPRSLSYYQANSLNKLKEFIKKIDLMIQKQKHKPLRMQSKLVSSVLDDLEIITAVVPSLYQKLVIKIGASSSPIAGDNFKLTTVDEVQIDMEDNKQIRETEAGKFVAIKTDTSRPFGGFDVGCTGNLVPFSCGHNGTLGEAEIEVCEYHLRAAGMI